MNLMFEKKTPERKGIGSKFCLTFSIFLTVLWIISVPLSIQAASYQCDVNSDNRLGLEETINFLQELSGAFTEGRFEILDCGEPNFEITSSGALSADAKGYILCRMNEIRSQVALGTIMDDGTNGFYPVATNMQRMQWDKDLATVAQNYASGCNYEHNPDRESDYAVLTGLISPAVGENIAATGISWTIDSAAAVTAIQTAFSGWNGENSNWYYDTINEASWEANIGHFTQNVWADTTKVGCGQAWCPGDYPDRPDLNMIFTVCNYHTAGNYWDHYPYQAGSEVCTEDMQSGDTCENGLISPSNYNTGLDFECDVSGDGLLGLEELIDALQVLSGQTL